MKTQTMNPEPWGLDLKNSRFNAAIKHHTHRAFTLIELMIVVVILGLLATVIMPRILDKPEKARRAKAKFDITSFETALRLFHTDIGRFPSTSEGIEALVANPGIKNYNDKGYLDKIPNDPWGNPYIYMSPGLHHKDYDLESYGKDGEDGGTQDDRDIENWNLDES
jgi:general secretion pathway protein G